MNALQPRAPRRTDRTAHRTQRRHPLLPRTPQRGPHGRPIWTPPSLASCGRPCSSTTTARTAPPTLSAPSPAPIRASAACAASAAAAWPAPSSRVRSHRPPTTSPSSMATCSTTKPSCPRCWPPCAPGPTLAVASRHVEGGSTDGLAGAWRHTISNLATRMVHLTMKVKLTDPMSGFFVLRRTLFERLAPRLTGQGFKILLDLLLSSPETLIVREVPARFHRRVAGESKLDVLIMLQFAGLLVDKLLRGAVPLRFIAFGLVGLFGVGVHLAALRAAGLAGLGFSTSENRRHTRRHARQFLHQQRRDLPQRAPARPGAGPRACCCSSWSAAWAPSPMSASPGRCTTRMAAGPCPPSWAPPSAWSGTTPCPPPWCGTAADPAAYPAQGAACRTANAATAGPSSSASTGSANPGSAASDATAMIARSSG